MFAKRVRNLVGQYRGEFRVGEVEGLDERANVLSEILEVVAIGSRLMTVAMAAAVKCVDGVVGGEFAGDVIPDLGNEAGAMHQEGRWLA